jgi:3-oxoacyl-[acyl-carrier-protein] synthase-1
MELGVTFHPRSATIPFGKVAGAMALKHARDVLDAERLAYCIVAGADSLLVAPTLAAYEAQNRLLTSKNSNGFLAGEAGAAVLACASPSSQDALVCAGIGFGVEKATVMSEEPLRADGMAQAIREAFNDSGKGYADVDYRIADVNGEQYYFKEAALAMSRTMRVRKEEFDIWTPVDCIGETGAAIGPSILAILLAANRKNYAPGKGVLAHFSGDGGERVVLVLQRT